MANKKSEETRTSIDNINDQLTSIEQKVQNNQRSILWMAVVGIAVVAVIFIYIYAFHKPAAQAGNDAIGQADKELLAGNDSIALAQYQAIAADHGMAAGNRAALNAAIILYKEKRYEEALNYLKDYSAKEHVIGAGAYSLEGDCYVNLEQYPQAVKCFDKAISQSDNNPEFTPFFMLKKATVLREMKDYKAELAVYEEIQQKYPRYGQNNQIDIQKYLELAKLRAAE